MKLGNSQRQNSFSESEKINISSRPQESVLIYEIVNHNWRAAQSRCLKYPEEASKWSEIVSKNTGKTLLRKLPIHFACQHCAPKDVIASLVDTYPRGVEEVDEKGKLPLHSLASTVKSSNTSEVIETMEYLMQKYPGSSTIADAKGMLAIHW